MLIEDRGPRLDLLELGPHLLEKRLLEHAGGLGRAVAVFLEDVPAAEDEVVEAGQRPHLIYLRRAAFRPLAEADRAHLGQRSDGRRESFTNGDDAGDGRRADGPEADEEHAEFAARRSDINWSRHKWKLYHLKGNVPESVPETLHATRRRPAPARGQHDGRENGPASRFSARRIPPAAPPSRRKSDFPAALSPSSPGPP